MITDASADPNETAPGRRGRPCRRADVEPAPLAAVARPRRGGRCGCRGRRCRRRPRTAAAADGDPLLVGATNTHTLPTNVNYSGATRQPASTSSPATRRRPTTGSSTACSPTPAPRCSASRAATGTRTSAITGWSKKPLGTGVVGFTGGAGAYGGEFFGGLAEVRLRPGGEAPITLTNAHAVGELYEDATGELWLCTAAGSPGTWRQIAGPTTAGAFHAISPRRVYDSRDDTRGKLAPDEDRVLSMATSTDGTPNVVPPFATAVTTDLHRHRHRRHVRLRVGSSGRDAVPEHVEHQLVRARPEPGDHGRLGTRRRSSDQRAGRRGTHPHRHRRRRLLPLTAGAAGMRRGGGNRRTGSQRCLPVARFDEAGEAVRGRSGRAPRSAPRPSRGRAARCRSSARGSGPCPQGHGRPRRSRWPATRRCRALGATPARSPAPVATASSTRWRARSAGAPNGRRRRAGRGR